MEPEVKEMTLREFLSTRRIYRAWWNSVGNPDGEKLKVGDDYLPDEVVDLLVEKGAMDNVGAVGLSGGMRLWSANDPSNMTDFKGNALLGMIVWAKERNDN